MVLTQGDPLGILGLQSTQKMMGAVLSTKFAVICYSSRRKPTHHGKNKMQNRFMASFIGDGI